MKITISEEEGREELEVVIHCHKADEQVRRLVAALSGQDKKLTGVRDGQSFVLALPDILYFDSVDKKTFAYTAGDVYEVPLRLYELEERLPGHFFRASKSAIINIDKITSIRPDFGSRLQVTLSTGEKLAVSRQYAQDLKAKLEM